MTQQWIGQGALFSVDFLAESIQDLPEWAELAEEDTQRIESELAAIFAEFPADHNPNESQTEDDLIWPILRVLGWTSSLRGQNMLPRGREVPDGVLFDDAELKARANSCDEEWKRYEFGRVVVESKRWGRPLDRSSEVPQERTAPAAQMIHYLRRLDDLTEGKIRWGILTNGAVWRLYYAGARSMSEEFFEIDLAELLGVLNPPEGMDATTERDRRHWIRVFCLIFGRKSFVSHPPEKGTFHQSAIAEGRYYEQRVSSNLSRKVFDIVFPTLVRAIEKESSERSLLEVRHTTLVLLYRLLFVLYAEDRDLLPVSDPRYAQYGLRNIRFSIASQVDSGDTFSDHSARYWLMLRELFVAIGQGDPSIGLPPYNGGLFDQQEESLLEHIRIPDSSIAPVIDALSFERSSDGQPQYINYRNLSVQHLGTVYEQLLEFDVVRHEDEVVIRPNAFARKSSGSYFTPDELVQLILRETVDPLIERCVTRFAEEQAKLDSQELTPHMRMMQLTDADPAEAILDLRLCDPAMGSGHFLVGLVDYLTDKILDVSASVEHLVPEDWGPYVSPLLDRIATIRRQIFSNARRSNWVVDEKQLDDRHIVRRMVLKRCVYGVDKNPMAVELAKVSLWLHTFTVGAPLSFLDHHLRCGDSLFGLWVKRGIDQALTYGSPLLLSEPIKHAFRSAAKMQIIEQLTDVEIAEAHRSAEVYEDVKSNTAPLKSLLSLIQALDWIALRDRGSKIAIASFFDGKFGDPIAIAMGTEAPQKPALPNGEAHRDRTPRAEDEWALFRAILDEARQLIAEENFLHWQVEFPTIWNEWDSDSPVGGFDAVIGNPPWDTVKLQQIEWFSDRKPEIAKATRRSERLGLIQALKREDRDLLAEFERASGRAQTRSKQARECGDFPLLSCGDMNMYGLFVERAMALINDHGLVGLLTPSGIFSDKPMARFFRGVATEGRVRALYDFENGSQRSSAGAFFPDVDSRFKFCVFVASRAPMEGKGKYAFFLSSVSEIASGDKRIDLDASDFALVNPNTGTAPLFRSQSDAMIVMNIYRRMPVLLDRNAGVPQSTWPVRYVRMFDMAGNSDVFRTREQLRDEEKAFEVGRNVYRSEGGDWLPLYVGRMINHFDHRASSVAVNPDNLHRPAVSVTVASQQKADPEFVPDPQYWVPQKLVSFPDDLEWAIAFRNITISNNARTTIAAIVPKSGYAHSLPILLPDQSAEYKRCAPVILGCMNSVMFDFIVRTKLHGTNLSWYIIEQMPVVSLAHSDSVTFGSKSATELIRDLVVELSYTSIDLAPFARDMGLTNSDREVESPFMWNNRRRLSLRAKLDALFMLLYDVEDHADVRYIYSTFPIMDAAERAEHQDRFISLELCIDYMNALRSGDSDVEFDIDS